MMHDICLYLKAISVIFIAFCRTKSKSIVLRVDTELQQFSVRNMSSLFLDWLGPTLLNFVCFSAIYWGRNFDKRAHCLVSSEWQ